jgi:hypothetical protein
MRAPEGSIRQLAAKVAGNESTNNHRAAGDGSGEGQSKKTTINRNRNTGGGWQRCHLRAVVDDWWQKWPATRETTAAMNSSGCWCLMVDMAG